MARPTLAGHRKFRRLTRALGSRIVARGALELLWESCYESGNDYLGTSDDIETLVEWTGAHGLLTRALVDAGAPEGHGFIEPVATSGSTTGAIAYRIHDLWHHAPEYVAKRRKRELERQQKEAPIHPVRHTAPDGGQCLPSPDCQNGVDRTPAPAPAPAPTPEAKNTSRTASAQLVVDLWNELVTVPIPQVTKLTADRATKIAARLRDHPVLDDWRIVIAWINQQAWCRASGTGDHPNWTATLDWLIRSPGGFQSLFERASQAVPRPVLGAPRADWQCPHDKPCGSERHCRQLQAIAAGKTAAAS